MLPLLLQDLQLQDHLLALTPPTETISETMHAPQLLLPLLLQSRPVGVSTRVKTLHPVTCFPWQRGQVFSCQDGILPACTGADRSKEHPTG
jgi:hypothetical protein